MAYKKTGGFINCRIVGFTPFWLDVKVDKSNQDACIFLKEKMSDKFRNIIIKTIESGRLETFIVKKIAGEDGHYKFQCFGGKQQMGIRAKTAKIIARQELEDTLNEGNNFVQGKGKQSLLTGREGLRNNDRTGTKLSRAIHFGIDNSKEKQEIKNKIEAIKAAKKKESILKKMRKKYLYDRDWLMLPIPNGGSDNQWDEYLWDNKDDMSAPRNKHELSFEQELKINGII